MSAGARLMCSGTLESHREVIIVRRFAVVVAFALMGMGSAAGLPSHLVMAQEATPAAQVSAEGITYLPLGYLPAVPMADSVDTEIARGTLEPGAGFPFTADDPASAMLIMESGELTATVEDASWTISRGAAVSAVVTGTPAASGTTEVVEIIGAGEAATFSAGDVAYIPGNATGEMHNSGNEQAVTLLITYFPAES
jgi:quercetin dioxygenase-like cupin family protein